MTLILLIVLASLIGSFLCSLCEAALYAVTPTRVESLRRAGGRGGRKLAQLRGRIDDAIAGILTLNTIAHTVGAAWAGALVGALYGNRWVGVFTVLFTLAILFLTEIVPKSIGVAWASVLAPRLAWMIELMIWTFWPIAKLCTWMMGRISRRAPGEVATEHEIMLLTEMAVQHGQILPEESRLVNNVLRLNNITARELMTPRDVVYSLPADLPLGRVQMRADHWVHSRLPLTEDRDPDCVLGIVERRAVFDQLIRGERTKTLRDLMRPPLFVTEQTRGHELLEQFISRHQHLAVFTNEQGKMIGVVSLEDVLEYLLGRAIVAEHDSHPRMQRLARARARFHAEPPGDPVGVGDVAPTAAAGTATTVQEAKTST